MGSKSNGQGLFGLVVAGVGAAIAALIEGNKKGKNPSQQSQS